MRILKYSLSISDQITRIPLSENALVAMVAEQHGLLNIWFRVPGTVERAYALRPTSELIVEALPVRNFCVVGTGHEIPDHWEYIGSAVCDGGRFVWHVYEVP